MKKILFACILLIGLIVGGSQATSLNGLYSHSISFTYNISSAMGNQTDYPVRFQIYNTSGVSGYNGTYNIIYTNGTTLPTWIDIAAADSNGDLVPFWIENNTYTATGMTMWVNVPHITVGNTSTGQIMFGNSSQTTSLMNGYATFSLFDDFLGSTINSTIWTATGSTVVGNGNLNINTASSYIVSTSSYGPYNHTMRSRVVSNTVNNPDKTVAFGFNPNTFSQCAVSTFWGGTPQYWTRASSSYAVNSIGISNNTWFIQDISTTNQTATTFKVNDANTVVSTTEITNLAMNITFFVGGGGGNIVSDWVFIRKSLPIEPFISVVPPPPIANFIYSPTSGSTPLTVNFTDTSQTDITSWNWTFGAANYSSLQNPSYTFVGAGNYSVTLQVTNTSGTNTTINYVDVLAVTDPNPTSMIKYKSGESSIAISNQSQPYVGTVTARNITSNTTYIAGNFTWIPGNVAVSNIRINQSAVNISGASLISSSINNANGYALFNISNPSGFTSPANALIDFNITYTKYLAPGSRVNFSYSLPYCRYYDPVNATWRTFNQYQGADAIIGTWGPIAANFTANVTAVAEYAPIQFTDTSTGYPDAWGWDFGDGSTSSAQNPVYSYATTGLKTVSLHSYMAENGTITDTITKTDYINVTAAPPPAPVADFTGTPTTVSLGTAVQFNDTSTYSPTSWSWNFGDSLGSSLQNPSHVYTSIGLYNVSLTATNAQGSDTKTRINYINVTALAPPVASFTSNVTSGAPPLSVQFTDTSTNNPTSWHWLISKNSSIYFEYYAQNYNYIFTEDGIYNASLTVSNAAGNSTTWKNITVINLSGFNRQDLYLSPEYTLVLTIKDTDGNVIPVVTVSDSDGNVANTTNGVYTHTYPYEAVAIYLSADGYQTRSITYVMNRDRVETVQMTAVTTQSQNTNIIYTQQQVRFIVMNSEGTKVNGATISASVMNSTLPSDSLTILQDAFGISANIAGIMLNGSEVMSGTTAGDGSLTFMMFPSLTYNLTITGVPAAPWYISVSPRETEYIIHQPTANVTSSYSNYLNTSITVTEPNSSYITLNAVYQDLSGATTNVKYYVVYRPNNTIIYYRDMGNPGKSAVTDNSVTVPNIRGVTYWAYFNKTTV